MKKLVVVKIWSVLLLLIVSCLPDRVYAEDRISKSYQRAARRYDFKINTHPEFPPGVRGRILPVRLQEQELNRFFAALDDLGEKFVRKCGLKRVVICRDLTHKGLKCAGFTLDDCIYLNYGFKKKIVYHEIFHVFDKKQHDPEWSKLNHRNFRYLGIIYPDQPQDAARSRALREHYRRVGRDFGNDFVSRYARSNEREDRAETFACMVDEGPAFMLRVRKSRVLYQKMFYIIEMTDRSSLLGRDYWQLRLGRELLQSRQRQERKKR